MYRVDDRYHAAFLPHCALALMREHVECAKAFERQPSKQKEGLGRIREASRRDAENAER